MFLLSIILCILWVLGIVDFKILKRKPSVKALNESCKALKYIEKGLSNKYASKKYPVPPKTILTWTKNKEK